MHPFRRGVAAMIRGAREQPRATALAMAAGLLNGVSMVLGAQALGWATDHFVVPSSDSHSFAGRAAVGTTLLVLGVCALRVTTITLRGVGTGAIQFAAQASSRRRLAASVLDADPAWLRRRPPGRLIATSLSDVDVAWLPMTWFPFAVGMVVMLVVALGAVALADPVLAAVAVVLVPVVLGATLTAQRLVPPRARTAQQARAAVSQSAHEAFGGHEVLRTLGATEAAVERFAAEVEALRAANVRTASVGAAFDPMVELAPTAAVLAVLAVGAERHAAGALSVGVLVQVVYLLLTAAIPLNVIGRFLSVLPASVVGQERIQEVLDAPVPPTPRDQGIRTRSGGARLQLCGAASPPALAATDLDLAPGRVTGLAGATGSGKTTLLGLAAGLVGPASGEVRLDGTPLGDLGRGETARHVAIVPQQPFLFGVSVRDNVKLGRVATDDEVRAALHVAGADFADDLDTILGEEGVRLSGGQRQRIAIARAVLGHPRLLLLDDATSALDPAVERVVLARLAEHARTTGATVLLTATRSASIELTDDVVYLAAGAVVASGRHEDLLTISPGYRELVEAYDEAAALASDGEAVAR